MWADTLVHCLDSVSLFISGRGSDSTAWCCLIRNVGLCTNAMFFISCVSVQEANQTLHTDRPDLPECFQLSVLSWLPCIYLWAVSPIYLFYLKMNNRGYIMMSIMNRFKTVRGEFICLLSHQTSVCTSHPKSNAEHKLLSVTG